MNENNVAITRTNKPMDTEQQEEHTPVLRVWLFEGGRLEWHVAPISQEEPWKGRAAARAIFLLLLCAPNRQALRGHLTGILWPEMEEENARSCLRSALKVLRQVLRLPQGQDPLIEAVQNGEVLQLKGQEVIWVDVDAFEALVQQASQETDAQRALLLWQKARTLLKGEVLAEDRLREWITHRWIKARRQRVQVARRRLVRSLADLYVQRGEHVRAEELLQEHIITFPTDQDALYRLMKLLIKVECFVEARDIYERGKAALMGLGKPMAEPLKALAERLATLPQTFLPTVSSTSVELLLPYVPSQSSVLTPLHISQNIKNEDPLSEVAKKSVTHLTTITQQFRTMQRQGDAFITSGVNTHIQTVQAALEQTIDDTTRRELWRVLAQTQIVAGFNPIKRTERARAKTFLEAAVASAQNSGDALLVSAALGHLAHFSLREEQNFTKASQLLSSAQELIQTSHPLNGWFALVNASIAARRGQELQCEASLINAMEVAHHLPQTPEYADIYFTDFSLLSVHIFAVNCCLVTGNAAKAYTHLQAINIEDLSDNRRASAFYDTSKTFAMMSEFERAQHFAVQAIDKALSTQQRYVISRCLALAQMLQQKESSKPYGSAIADYVRFAFQQI